MEWYNLQNVRTIYGMCIQSMESAYNLSVGRPRRLVVAIVLSFGIVQPTCTRFPLISAPSPLFLLCTVFVVVVVVVVCSSSFG